MSPERYQQVSELFLAACEQKTAERLAFIERTCGDDSELRDLVVGMLERDTRDTSFVDRPVLGPASELPSPADLVASEIGPPPDHRAPEPEVPKRIGEYQIVGVLGRGGMGTVYRAIQPHPRRTVALKVIPPGAGTARSRRRFEYEAELLGRLQHPGIAQVYEAGIVETDWGSQPFLAMELVQGRPLTAYAAAHHLDHRARLALLIEICDAVHHAHLSGVIHRDLKPANILVTDDGQPKILDFGVARAVDHSQQPTMLLTNEGQLIGTLPYMSPEQVSGRPEEIDLRCDVYALGVLGYELLTGRLPYEILDRPLAEAAQVIRDVDPTPPGTISTVLRGDVDAILGKALEKEPPRRYASAHELAADIRRHLADQPITAHPPSAFYQLRKFARRNRPLVVGLTGTFAALLVGIAGTTWGLVRAVEARDDARAAAQKAMLMNEQLKSMLTSVDPLRAQGREVTMRDALDDMAANLDTAFPANPELEADLRATIGRTYRNLGDYDAAEQHLRLAVERLTQVHGETHASTLVAMTNLALVLTDVHAVDEAEPLLRRTIELKRLVLGDEDPETLRAMNNLAWLLYNQDRVDDALPLFRQVCETQQRLAGAPTPLTIKSMTNLAAVLIEVDRLDEAAPLVARAVADAHREQGGLHPDTMYVDSIAAYLDWAHGDHAAAAERYEGIVGRSAQVLGEDHPFTLYYDDRFARILVDLGEPERAVPLAARAYDGRLRVLGADNTSVVVSKQTIALVAHATGRQAEAHRQFVEALAEAERLTGPTDPLTIDLMNEQMTSYIDHGDLEHAEALARRMLERLPSVEPITRRQRVEAEFAERVIPLHERLGRPDEADRWRERLEELASALP